MYSFKELQQIIESKLKQIELSAEPKELYEPVQYILDIGGKRIRPTLVLAACNIFKDDITEAVFPALALEVFHNFTLLHDDIMDKADLRRNQQTVHKKWSENVAILSGDAMSIKAYDLLAKSPHNYLPKILQGFNKTALEVCEGQQFDMNFESRLDVTIDEYLEMIRLKTSVLIAISIKIGAILGGASKTDAQRLYDFGLNIGLAFQLQDDYLDTYGNVKVFGKKIGGDILANKKTFLLIKALEISDKENKAKLLELIQQTDIESDKKIKTVKDIYNKADVGSLLKQKMTFYYNNAINAINSLQIDDNKLIILKEFAETLMDREN